MPTDRTVSFASGTGRCGLSRPADEEYSADDHRAPEDQRRSPTQHHKRAPWPTNPGRRVAWATVPQEAGPCSSAEL
jgi:hypothetical protein